MNVNHNPRQHLSIIVLKVKAEDQYLNDVLTCVSIYVIEFNVNGCSL